MVHSLKQRDNHDQYEANRIAKKDKRIITLHTNQTYESKLQLIEIIEFIGIAYK